MNKPYNQQYHYNAYYAQDALNIALNEHKDDLKIINKLAEENKLTFKKGEHLYKFGDSFKNIFLILNGSIKVYSINELGDEQITSFHTQGDLIAFDAITSSRHLSFAQTLEETMVGLINFNNLCSIAITRPSLNMLIFKNMSAEITQKKNIMMLITKQNASQRLASFLLYNPYFKHSTNQRANIITLTMTREEIGKYLSLKNETISRLLTKFDKQELIKVNGKNISILSPQKLLEIINNKDN